MLKGLAQGQQQFLVIPGLAQVTVDLPFVDGLGNQFQVRVAGQQDAGGARVLLMDTRQQGRAIHLRQMGGADHQVHLPAGQELQGLGGIAGEMQRVGKRAEQLLQALQDHFLAIDQQNLGSACDSGNV